MPIQLFAKLVAAQLRLTRAHFLHEKKIRKIGNPVCALAVALRPIIYTATRLSTIPVSSEFTKMLGFVNYRSQII